MQFFTIHLPVKGYVKKYLQTLYGTNIIISTKTKIGQILLLHLSTNLSTKMDEHDIDLRMNRLTETLPLRIPFDYWYRLKLKEVSPHMAISISRFFEEEFKEEMYDVVNRAVQFIPGLERKKAIENFAQNHGIEIEFDITYEALKKMEYRFREERESILKKSMAGLSPQKQQLAFT